MGIPRPASRFRTARRAAATLLAALLAFAAAPAAAGLSENAYGRPPKSDRDEALGAGYFPFQVIGHGVLLVAKYGIGYPIYYAFRPVLGFLYESSEDPRAYDRDDP